MNKLRSLLMAVGMVLAFGFAWGETWTDDDGCTWTYSVLSGGTTVSVSKVEPCEYDIVIPAAINGKSVVAFSDTMFKANTKISSVEIPDGVTAIGANAFAGCSQLQQVKFGEGIKSIGNWAFQNCVLLLKAELPMATTTLGIGCFSGCVKLNTAKLPGVTRIPGAADDRAPGSIYFDGYGAFYNCDKLKTLQLGDKLTSIGNGAFYNCNELYDVTIPDAVSSIGNWSFAECDKLNTVVFGADLYQIGCDAFLNDVKLASVSFRGEKLRILGSEAFRNCQGLDGLTLPNGLLTIKSWCFCNCKAMRAIAIPDTVVTNEVGAFANCSALLTAKIGKGLTYIAGAADDRAPGSIYFDGYGAFSGCTSLTNVEISAIATRIECGAFYGCSALPEVVIPEKVREVKGYAFAECAMLKKVIVGDSVRLIGNNAFCNDRRLETLKLGAKVQTIQAEAFLNCTALKSFEFPETLMTIGNWAFGNCDALGVVMLPDSLGSAGVGVFAHCNGLTDVLIGESLEEVTGAGDDRTPGSIYFDGYGMFYDCTSLTNVHFGSSVATIGCGAFYGCSALREIDVPSCVTSIKPYAFTACLALQKVHLADGGITSIGQYAFMDDANLESVSLGNRLQSIGSCAFQSCKKLNNVILPETLQTLGTWSFNACSALSRIEIPDSVVNLNSGAFANCPSLTTVKIGTGVLTVSGAGDNHSPGSIYFDGYGAFSGCTALKTLDLGSVSTIACGAFYGCTALETVTIPDSVTKIAPYAFANCPLLRTVTIGESLATLGNNAFAGDRALRYVEFKGETAPASLGSNVFADTNGRMTTYVASGSTGWTGVHQGGLPTTWCGKAIAYAPPPQGAINPYDFYPHSPTFRVSSRDKTWKAPVIVTGSPYLTTKTDPTALTGEIYLDDPVYLSFCVDEYWRGESAENLTNLFALTSGGKSLGMWESGTAFDRACGANGCVTTNDVIAAMQGLPVGDYELTMVINPARNLAETDYSNNETSITFKVVKRPPVKVTFNRNGGSGGTTSLEAVEYRESLPAITVPTKSGSVFLGYWTSADWSGAGVQYYAADGTGVRNSDLKSATTLYARWVKSNEIVFLANGGTGVMPALQVKSGVVHKLPPCAFAPPEGTPAGTTFAGWACSNGRRYDDEMLVFGLGGVTMTAIWWSEPKVSPERVDYLRR